MMATDPQRPAAHHVVALPSSERLAELRRAELADMPAIRQELFQSCMAYFAKNRSQAMSRELVVALRQLQSSASEGLLAQWDAIGRAVNEVAKSAASSDQRVAQAVIAAYRMQRGS